MTDHDRAVLPVFPTNSLAECLEYGHGAPHRGRSLPAAAYSAQASCSACRRSEPLPTLLT